MRRFWLAAAVILPALVVALTATSQTTRVQFVNVASEVRLAFKHENGGTPEKYLPETMGGGALFWDFDGDGSLDVFLVNSGSLADKRLAAQAQHRLYRNSGGKFADVTEQSGIKSSGYGMGACSADYDNDGLPDLYITSFGPNKLYHNLGGGRFADVTASSGTGLDLWSASCAWADIDNDGDVDLYVARYVDFTVEKNKICIIANNARGYCHPNAYNSLSGVLYRNNGDGTFSDITREAGVQKPGNGLGVVFGDYDGDGWVDFYVANDSTPNFLFHNKHNGTFEETGLWAGVAVSSNGTASAGMGTDMGDVDGDGLPDIFVANLDAQSHSLYKNLGKGLFSDVTFISGIGPATLPYVGFGAVFLDYDNDGDLDLAIANGHVLDNVRALRASGSYEQLSLLLENDGAGKFRSVGPASGPAFQTKRASRGLAAGDFDNDGDIDLLVSNIGQAAELLRNDGGNRENSLLIRTVGTKSNRDGIGARLSLSVGARVLVRERKAGSSYLAQNDMRIHFGLGSAPRAERLEIRWPSGMVDVVEGIEANQILTVQEGRGVIGRQPFARNR